MAVAAIILTVIRCLGHDLVIDLGALHQLVVVGRRLATCTAFLAVDLNVSGSEVSLTDKGVVGHIGIGDHRLAMFSIQVGMHISSSWCADGANIAALMRCMNGDSEAVIADLIAYQYRSCLDHLDCLFFLFAHLWSSMIYTIRRERGEEKGF